MGTVLELTLVTSHEPAGRAWIERAFGQVAELERLFSSHDPESELSRLNSAAGSGPQDVDRRLVELLGLAMDYASQTQGCFDVSVAPLVQLWLRAVERQRVPSASELSRARGFVGPEALRLFGDARVEVVSSGAAIDLGGIAKGYALDRLAAELRERSFGEALLSFGQSSWRALGAPPGESGWRLLLRSPTGGFAGFVTLRDRALSVSSSLGQWSLIGDARYGHVIDPRSGQPISRGLEAAVITSTAAFAEALSTAMIVMGESEGVALIESLPDTEVMFINETGELVTSVGWQHVSQFEAIGPLEPGKPLAPAR